MAFKYGGILLFLKNTAITVNQYFRNSAYECDN
jgi:hypothetical protein